MFLLMRLSLARYKLRELTLVSSTYFFDKMPGIFIEGRLIAHQPTAHLGLVNDPRALVGWPLLSGIDQAVHNFSPLLCNGARTFFSRWTKWSVSCKRWIALVALCRSLTRDRHSVKLCISLMNELDWQGRNQTWVLWLRSLFVGKQVMLKHWR